MRKRISKYKHLHSNRFRYLSSSIPLVCASGLLALVGLSICPSGSSEYAVYANSSDPKSDTTDDGIALTLGSASLKKDSTTASMNYISTPVNIVAKDVESYHIVVQAASGNGNLVGLSNGEEIKGVGTNIATNAFANNTWGYKLAEGSVSEANLATLTYNSLPANGAGANTPAYTQKTDNEAANGKAFTLAFAAKFSDDIMPDHYQTDVLVSLAASPKAVVEYSITYNANGGTGTPNPASQSISSKEDTYSFTAAAQGTLARTGYTFLGWATKQDAINPTYASGTNIILDKNSPTMTFYAVWRTTQVLNNISYMQDFNSGICANANQGDTKQLIDRRDSKKYWVTKLRDGNCWMTQNLDYDDPASIKVTSPSGTSVNKWQNYNNDNIVREYLDPGDYIYTNGLPGELCDSAIMSGDLAPCASHGWQNVTGWTVSNNTDAPASNTSNKIYNAHYHVGNYYSYDAAVAGTAPTTIGQSSAPGSICPVNWKLPTMNDYVVLFNNQNSEGLNALVAEIVAKPFYFIPSGMYNSYLNSISEEGLYWTSTLLIRAGDTSSSARRFLFDADGRVLSSHSAYNRHVGQPIRCLVLGS